MMKSTSCAPIVGIVVVLGLAVLMMVRSFSLDARGASGPLMVSGIFPFTEEFYPSPDSGLFEVTKSIEVISNPADLENIPGLRLQDERQGIETAPWEEVVLVAEDRHPVTSSVIRALAEIITVQQPSAIFPIEPKRYPVVILQPVDGDPLPIGCQRVIRVATTGSAPENRDDLIDVVVSIAHQDLLPSVDVGSIWNMWPARSIAEQAVEISYKQKPLRRVAWADRFVSLGRDIAEQSLATFTDAGVVSLDTDGLELTDFHGPWDSQIPQQSSHTVVRWFGSIQSPLIRGWAGSLIGQRARYRGMERDSMELFAEHLARGQWEPRHAQAANQALLQGEWRNERFGSLQRLWMQGGDFGWDVLGVEPHPNPSDLFQGWLNAAQSGDRVARVQLRRHLTTPFFTDEQRSAAQARLRINPDAKELAMLGELPDATESERSAKHLAQWVFGFEKGFFEEERNLPRLSPAESTPWDGRSKLIEGPAQMVFFVQQLSGNIEIRWRSPESQPQVWLGEISTTSDSNAPLVVTEGEGSNFSLILK